MIVDAEKIIKILNENLKEKYKELDRLRWNYPEQGELPEFDHYLTTEWYEDSHIYNIRYYRKDLSGFEKRQITQCYRWRYIE